MGIRSAAEAARINGFRDPENFTALWDDELERGALGLYALSYLTPAELDGTLNREIGRAELIKAWCAGDHEIQRKERFRRRTQAAVIGPLFAKKPTGA